MMNLNLTEIEHTSICTCGHSYEAHQDRDRNSFVAPCAMFGCECSRNTATRSTAATLAAIDAILSAVRS